jgi:hypothetical protein
MELATLMADSFFCFAATLSLEIDNSNSHLILSFQYCFYLSSLMKGTWLIINVFALLFHGIRSEIVLVSTPPCHGSATNRPQISHGSVHIAIGRSHICPKPAHLEVDLTFCGKLKAIA